MHEIHPNLKEKPEDSSSVEVGTEQHKGTRNGDRDEGLEPGSLLAQGARSEHSTGPVLHDIGYEDARGAFNGMAAQQSTPTPSPEANKVRIIIMGALILLAVIGLIIFITSRRGSPSPVIVSS